MRIFVGVAVLAALPLVGGSTYAADAFQPPAWAYPVMDEGRGRGPDDGTVYTREGSNLRLTQTQINDAFNPPDWYPNEHPALPQVVAHGRMPDVRACALCHLPHGAGHPESASLAGQPAAYIAEQMYNFKNGERKSLVAGRSGSMITIAGAANDEEIQAAAAYFSSVDPVKWVTVMEAAMVPETYVGAGSMRHAEPEGGMEPIGNRIIEIPEDSEGAELRDAHTPFMAYVPPGSLAKGEELVTTGGNGKTVACATCHGPDLTGLANFPGIAGRSPIYIARQLWDIKHNSRGGAQVALMQPVVANLTDDDVLNIAAYVASLDP